MRTRSGWIAVAAMAAIVAGLAAPALADEGDTGSYMDGALRKLGRGIANVATCPAELVRTPTLVGRKDGYPASLSVGIVEGAWRTIVRGVTGVFEIATFYAEIPKGFGPLMKPEFVWTEGNWSE